MVNSETIALIKDREGEVLTAYYDSNDGWTIGVGHLSDSYFPVHKGLVITKEKSTELLQHDLKEAEDIVDNLVKVPLNENQRGALVSFVFNLGGGNFKSSTLLRKLNAGDYKSVPSELNRWVHDDGKVLRGLKIRRKMEGDLFMKPVDEVETKPEIPKADALGAFLEVLGEILYRLFGWRL